MFVCGRTCESRESERLGEKAGTGGDEGGIGGRRSDREKEERDTLVLGTGLS